jgi:hypothetical protein
MLAYSKENCALVKPRTADARETPTGKAADIYKLKTTLDP